MTAILPLERHFARVGAPVGGVFTERNLFPWIQRRTRPLEDGPAAAARLLAERRPGKRVAYLHVPFCANHCLFCGFYRNRSAEDAMAEYASRLERDIAMDETAAGGPPIQAVYFGGGTPSALSADDLHRLVSAVRRHLPLAPDCEITIEGRVAGFGDDKIDACLEAGANRFSIGVQTFDTGLRQRMGRKASRQETISFMERLRDRDRAVVVCDLILGLPGQDMETWRNDVATCLSLGLDGVDLYCLTLHDKSPLALSIAKGSLPPAAGLERMAAMYGAGLEMLEDAGWRHLNQAHWASATRERNLYNQLVKAGADCLAFGAGAGGLVQGHRYVIQPDIDLYGKAVDSGTKPVTVVLPPPANRQARDLVMGGLEGGRLDIARLESLTAPGLAATLEPLLAQWAAAGLIRRRANAIILTTAGWFWHCNLVGSLFELIDLSMGGGTPPADLSSPQPQGIRHAG
ncbi:heme anaerobic degradation radical SAM methyltransferase ChuW/HutW [Magnetospirillum sp. SS-4]|uniref:heme anaerobic degradation radical SAM methyltransferase ChuW/HutW n=1 Tax=Magnetospirillum sp. SS-4 TaxID=2681465 RepID=UPI0013816210|nr:heme anaerobic degradation radical SAM methyltransferase ChuW/HutW [Magnetospirillum sp. SS-4]CAA7620098.1 Coproporphyrinogen III oxidase [Magnetospirillum sp. SS-4]